MLAAIFCGAFAHADAQQATSELRIGVVTPTGAPTSRQMSALRGVRLGASEAMQTARLFGDAVELYEASGDGKTRRALAAAMFLSSVRKVQVLIGIDSGAAESLARFANQRGIIFLNIASRSDSFRLLCGTTFHIEASDHMYAAAARLRADLLTGSGSAGRGTDSVVLWHPTLERFGASQLNDRYSAAFHVGMDGGAWAGWAAVKFVAEAVLRVRSTQPMKLRAYLLASTTQFDGHKGWPLSFRPLDHQLRQPLYIVVQSAAGVRAVDVPDLRSISSATSDRAAIDALDRLAPSESCSTRGD
ncbi:MAG TPA: ABC transporter substrate-binding protein [Gemmatimonadaceae bacterium]